MVQILGKRLSERLFNLLSFYNFLFHDLLNVYMHVLNMCSVAIMIICFLYD